MKILKIIVAPLLLTLCFGLFSTQQASAQGLEMTIMPSAAGPFYEGYKADLDCNGSYTGNTWGTQFTNTGVYYPGNGTDMPTKIEVTDAMGNSVVVCDPVNGFCPSVAVLPTGTVVEFQHWGGCGGHPAVVVIY